MRLQKVISGQTSNVNIWLIYFNIFISCASAKVSGTAVFRLYPLPSVFDQDILTAWSYLNKSFPSNENQTKQKNDMLAKLWAQGKSKDASTVWVREKTTTSDSLRGKKKGKKGKKEKKKKETTHVQKHGNMWEGLSKPQDL